MDRIYFDNAATTSLDGDVLEAMMPFLTREFGNPSSTHFFGRETRAAIETTRTKVAHLLNCAPREIFFTSCGTESTNTALNGAVEDLGCTRIITSPIEHHATLHTCEHLHQVKGVKLEYVHLLPNGQIDLEDLENRLQASEDKTIVSLMHGNNEIGNLLDIEKVGLLCQQYQVYFHCDTVQTVGHFPIDLKKIHVHFINASAHKFHGPKGIGILYVNKEIKIHSYLQGGGQERSMRAGTENIYGIIGFGKALEAACEKMEEHRQYIRDLKFYMAKKLQENIDGVSFNGDWDGNSLYTVLNVSLPRTDKSEVLLIKLDLEGICVSGGSACNAGANIGSHVIAAVNPDLDRIPIRFSFSKYNTKEEIDRAVSVLTKLL